MAHQDRLALRNHVRHQMRTRGLLTFCDDQPQEGMAWDAFRGIQDAWSKQAQSESLRSVLKAGVATSTTDHPLQGINSTLQLSPTEFWSSTGCIAKSNETLLYATTSYCMVCFVRLAFYRATYQHGDPVYPSFGVTFYVGPSPTQMYLASPMYPIEASDRLQVFALSTSAPVGSYVAVRFYGKRQQQWEDNQYYVAVRHVSALGKTLPAHTLPKLQRAVRGYNLHWGAPWFDSACTGKHLDKDTSTALGTAAAAGLKGPWSHLQDLFSGGQEHGVCPNSATSTSLAAHEGHGLSAASIMRTLQTHPHMRTYRCSREGAGEAVLDIRRQDGLPGEAEQVTVGSRKAEAVSSSKATADDKEGGAGGISSNSGRWGGMGLRGWLFGHGWDQDRQAAVAAAAEQERRAHEGEQARQAAQAGDNTGPLVASLIHWLLSRIQARQPDELADEGGPGQNMEFLEALAERLAEGGGAGGLPAGPFLVQQLLHIQSEMLAEDEERRQVAVVQDTGPVGIQEVEQVSPMADLQGAGAGAGLQQEHLQGLLGWPASTLDLVAGHRTGTGTPANVTSRLLFTSRSKRHKIEGSQTAEQVPAALVLFSRTEHGSAVQWPVSDYDVEFL